MISKKEIKELQSMSYEELIVCIKKTADEIFKNEKKLLEVSAFHLDLMMETNKLFYSFDEFPESISDFEKFYSAIKSYCFNCKKPQEIKDIKEWIEKNVICISSISKTYLLDELTFFMVWMQKSQVAKEHSYVSEIIENFEAIFPDYEFIEKEKFFGDKIAGGRADIFAKDKKTGKPAIIEVKLGNVNPARQLKKYRRYYGKDAILVALTQKECKNKQRGIVYVVYGKRT